MPTATTTKPNVLGFRIAHRTMRGDLHRLTDLAEQIGAGATVFGPVRAKALRDYLFGVCDGIHHHHDTEDRVLWPVLERCAGAEVDLTELTDDHAELDPLLDRARAAVTRLAAAPADQGSATELAAVLTTLRDLLDEHIEEEERTIFPIIERYVSAAEWNEVEHAARKNGRVSFELPRIERFARPEELAELHKLAGPVLRLMLAVIRPGFRRRERLIFG